MKNARTAREIRKQALRNMVTFFQGKVSWMIKNKENMHHLREAVNHSHFIFLELRKAETGKGFSYYENIENSMKH